MFNIFKKKEDKKEELNALKELTDDINNKKLTIMERELMRQKVLNNELLQLITMIAEHKDYSRYILPKITKIRNILDKK